MAEAGSTLNPAQKTVLQYTHTPITDAQGAVIGVSCLVQDITARHLAELELKLTYNDLARQVDSRRQSDERFAQLVDTVPHGIEEIDLEEEVVEEAVSARRSAPRAAAAVEEVAHESAAVKAFLVLTSLVMILGVPVAMAFSNNQISSLARGIAGFFDFDKVMPN